MPDDWLEVDAIVWQFEQVWHQGGRPAITDFLPQDNRLRLNVLKELILVDQEWRRQVSEPRSIEDYLQCYPELAGLLTNATMSHDSPGPAPGHVESAVPQQIGRYHVEKILGQGGFGVVYLAHDDQLQRLVAIKVPHARLVVRPEDAQAYLTEARTVASLDHPNIVPVFDAGGTARFPCYIVTKYIDGTDLATRLKQSRLPLHEAVELVATVAEALHHAHKQGFVHRDVKPGNILIDKSGKPFVGDFGLALREKDVGKGPRYAGTPAYMSPEQARGEGHRVDGRSDVFGLGVVFYELLTGRRPFRAETQAELLEQIASVEARPLRQLDDSIPKELDRICLKALSKRASERYFAARDMADDLRDFLVSGPVGEQAASRAKDEVDLATPLPPSTTPAIGDSNPVKIVPKGLRSFDAADADFFLELLPGPRDRDGLPDSIRFWKGRIEATDPDLTFSVGLIYGPSGCGKSSMIKAGLLPRLAKSVTAVYVESAGRETETRLLKGLRRQVPELPGNLGLVEALAMLRRGLYLKSGQKVLLVLDQFEQWLHTQKEQPSFDLVQGLRQCDGGRLQAVVMVRDDFWMAATRFMQELEVRLVEAENSAAVDLFPIRHAEKVLAAFGRAFGELPPNPKDDSKEQRQFLHQSVAGLAQEDKVISVRLALFAEMVKGKPWTPATLKEIGGTAGVGLTFLEETFTTSAAPPQHRLHQKAAQAVLKCLLPEAGANIKGHMRSREELLEASGYVHRPSDFEDLIRILDREIRLITPTDPEGQQELGGLSVTSNAALDGRYYQLTHDYLVPSLREWLTRKQKETRRGRAELLLADQAAVWNARPENRRLPSLAQWLEIRWLTAKRNWTLPQRKMMGKARRYHALRSLVTALLLTVVTPALLMIEDLIEDSWKSAHAGGLVQAVLTAETTQTPVIIGNMAEYRKWTDPILREVNNKAPVKSRQKLHASLALLPVDDSQVDYLCERLLEAQPQEVPTIRDALVSHRKTLLARLWAAAEAPPKGKESQRLRAAAALASYDPDSVKWTNVEVLVTNDLVAAPAVYLAPWLDSLRAVRQRLIPPLSAVYRDPGRRETERSMATDILAEYAADDAEVLTELLMDAGEKQFAVIYAKLKEQGGEVVAWLNGEIDKRVLEEVPFSADKRERLAKRQANAAIALLHMSASERIWPLLKHSCDPRLRSYLIDRLGPLGADAGRVIKQLDEERDISIRQALVLSLGEFSEKQLSSSTRNSLLPKLQEMYCTDSDPGVHAAVEWLLRQWKVDVWLKQVTEEWAGGKVARGASLRHAQGKVASPGWYVNTKAQTLVVIAGWVGFVMGSPVTEMQRYNDEKQHKMRIGRSFALSAKPVTLGQYRQFESDYKLNREKEQRKADLPVVRIDWYRAARYCNWLSKEEGIAKEEWCYEIDGNEIKLKPNYLSLIGYRLPTEAEMEYATRAGTLTARYYGETEELLPKYAWYNKNSQEMPWPVGSLRPNGFGFFDTLGNVYTWCQETYHAYSGDEDKEDILEVIPDKTRALRGGSFAFLASTARSACRADFAPTARLIDVGFRVARTLPPGSLNPLPTTPTKGNK